ncbi:PD-(D/E)XK nuclease family protein [Candidatus Gottesmanbacteria bacterium]|nr:PD-(D/E)XK nuclease family protein [Candidatus Gottesmanbacteria bacterium]
MKPFSHVLKYFLTILRGSTEISQTREVLPAENREAKPVIDSLSCPYCQSKNFQKRGFRTKKRERVQLYLCLACRKTFTPHTTKGKHYPLAIMLDAISIYNLGYSLEATCRIVNLRHQKTASYEAASGYGNTRFPEPENYSNHSTPTPSLSSPSTGSGLDGWRAGDLHSISAFAETQKFSGSAPSSGVYPPPQPLSHINLQPSTLSSWITETEELCRFARMREFAMKRFSPKDMVVTATLAHRQLYRYRFHRGKCDLIIREEYGHRKFAPLADFLELVPAECPHQYFSQGLRASEAPLTFSKTAMIVRGKTNYATRLAAFVLQSVADRKARHEAVQKFMLANDSVTVATEVPVYITRDDLEHMKSQLGFELFGEMPKLITGHIDVLQIRNGQIHILDYKPNAEKERPIEQLTLYAMALSRLTGLRLFEFKCAWFDEKDYFEFYPLHVLHKPKKALRRRKVVTQEGTYTVNKNEKKVEAVRPIYI